MIGMPKAGFLTDASWSKHAFASSTANIDGDAVANRLLNPYPSEPFKTLDLVTIQITLDAGTPRPWNAILLAYHNGTAAGTLEISADDDSGNLFLPAADYNVTESLRYPGVGEFQNQLALHIAPTIQTHRYIGLEVLDPTNPDGYFSAGVAYVGLLVVPDIQAGLGGDIGYRDLSVKIEMSNGETRSRVRDKKMVQTINWEYQDEASANLFLNLMREYGESREFMIIKYPEDPAYSRDMVLFGLAQSYRRVTDQAPRGWSSVGISMQEA